MKLIGIVCIIAGSTGVGMSCAQDLELRIAELLQIRQWVILLKGELRYMHQPLPEAFLHLSEKAASPFREFFVKVGEDMVSRKGQSAENIWKQHLGTCVSGLHMTGKEIKELEKLGNVLGYLDVEMQINALDYYLEQLELSSTEAQEASRSRRKLYQYMGILGGVALSILIF